jgi:hypothetical protein
MDQVTLSKYLGGDEAHTHLVKGLDVALARRVRREINKGITETNTKKLLPPKQTEKSTVIMVRDANEARELLQNVKIESISSELGQQILRCLKRSHLPSLDLSKVTVPASPAGLAIQRSTLTFSTLGDPRDRNRAWELPLESMQASVSKAAHGVSSNTEAVGATSLDSALLHQIQCAFGRHTTSIEDIHGRSSDDNGQTYSHLADNGGDDEDEEDIFDEDDDYAPPTQAGSKRPISYGKCSEDSQSQGIGQSIFSGLTAPRLPQSTPAASSRPVSEERAVSKHKVISRDVLGAMSQALKNEPKEGISITSYSGGYGEEMDVDFDVGFDADEGDDTRGKSERK